MEGLTIGQVAKAAEVQVETIRYYEKIGMISAPTRTESGYRQFAYETVENIRFIKRAQMIGFSLKEIKILLSLSKSDCKYIPEELQQLAHQKIMEIEKQMEQLIQMKNLLEKVTNPTRDLDPATLTQCPIIQKCTEGVK